MPFDQGRNKVWLEVTEFLQRFINKDSTVLDLGAGYCHFINNIQAKSKYVLDIDGEILNKYANQDVNIISSDIMDFEKYTKEKFHVIFASNIFEHISINVLHQLIPKLKESLYEEGLLIILQPNYRYAYKEYFDDYDHVTILDHVSLQRLLKVHNFNIEKVYKKFLPYSMDSNLPTFRWLVWLYLRLPFKIMGKQMLVVASKASN